MRNRLLRDGYSMLAIAFVGLRLAQVRPWDQSVDAYAYWTTRSGDYYQASNVGELGSYLYSPAFAQLLAPLTILPWAVFVALWTAVLMGVYWWLVGRLALPLLLFIPIPFEIVSGNVHLLYAAVVVLGFSYPALWAFPLLTKVTPGIGLLWFAVRREWRNLAIALGATAAITAVSFVLAPQAWRTWIDTLTRGGETQLQTVGWYLPIALWIRLVAAAALIVWGGLTDRRWTVPVAMTLAMPVLWLNSLAVLAALPALAREQSFGPRWLRFGQSAPDRVDGRLRAGA